LTRTSKIGLLALPSSTGSHRTRLESSGDRVHRARKWVQTAILAALLGAGGFAHAQKDDLAWKRSESLKRGINATKWFAQTSQDTSVEHLRTYTTEDDIALIESLGFDHVRLSIDPVPLSQDLRPDAARKPFLDELDRAVDLVLKHHLSVILDIQPEDPFKAGLRSGDDPVDRFVLLWTALASHYAAKDPERVFFEIMNEPEQTDLYRWIGIEAKVAQSIRASAPGNTIIATGAPWSGLQDLLRTEPIALSNVIYTFHDYDPFAFTHQGATWTDTRVRPLRAVPYPSTPDAVQQNLPQEDSLDGQFFVEEYGLARWDAERVERTIEYARKWSEANRVPVYCGEFGVLRDYVDPAMRAAWLHDMVTALEKNHIGWAMWDYQDNFGLVRRQNGLPVADPQIVQALGLHPSQNPGRTPKE
jgi:endoglucanase